jgi:mono/diheme cytochrome c family protein
MKRTQLKYVFSLLLFIVVTIAAAGGYILARGISARDEPSAAEAFVARRLRHFAIPRRARELTNPVKASPEVLAAATAHFADHCASCHGNDGRGATLLGRGLYPKPPNMTAAATQQLTDGELYYIIENGIRFTGMPGFGEKADDDSDAESWDLVHFIRHLPQMTDDEIAAMKQLNPKSPAELEKEERIRKFLQGDDSQPAEGSHEHHH